MDKRDHLVDAIKGLGIIFVVGGHSGTPFSRYYYTFHMGLFFFLSGYLMASTDKVIPFIAYLRKKAIKLFLPYASFFLISLIFAELWSYKNNGSLFSLEAGHFKAFFLGGGYLNDFTMNFPLWFFHTLFLADLCMFFIKKLPSIIKVSVFILFILLTIPFQRLLPGRPIFHINVLPAGLVYMLFGYGINKFLGATGKRIQISYGIGMLFAGWYLSNKFGGSIAGIEHLCYYLESFFTILGFWIVFTNVRRIKILEYIGERSIFVLGLHSLFLYISAGFVRYIKLGVGFENEFLYHILLVTVTLILCCCIADIYRDINKVILKSISKVRTKIMNNVLKGEKNERI